jgi:hypothetical protein
MAPKNIAEPRDRLQEFFQLMLRPYLQRPLSNGCSDETDRLVMGPFLSVILFFVSRFRRLSQPQISSILLIEAAPLRRLPAF